MGAGHYDQYTGNMKTFEFEVGNTPSNLTGTLGWNSNRTLGRLAVVDGFNSGGSETCYSNSSSWLGYGYDDWARLLAFDCGSGNVAEYTTFDIYDNVTETVPTGRIGWTFPTPGYNSSNNQISGNTYDANGNTTADGGSNVYGYNEFSRMKWTASSGTPTCGTTGNCITYDAFGRAVENSSGATWTEIWYTQVPGSKVAMNGATVNSAYWPSPGRGTVLVGGTNTFSFLHQDWLGDDRIVSTINGHSVYADRAYTPYGQQYNTFGSANPIFGIFAGDTGDFDSGILWDTPNREFAINQLRFTSPDPAGTGWNQYGYPSNPNSFIDPSGLQLAGPGGCNMIDGCSAPGFDGGGGDSADCSAEYSVCSGYYYEGFPVSGGTAQWLLSTGAFTIPGYSSVYINGQYWLALAWGGTSAKILGGGATQYDPNQDWYDWFSFGSGWSSELDAATNNWQQGPDPLAVAAGMRRLAGGSIPTVCGGGVFAYGGKGGTAFLE